MWLHAAELRVWRAHRAKMVFLCLGARITVGSLPALIGPDGRPRRPSSVPLTFPQLPLYRLLLQLPAKVLTRTDCTVP